MTDSGKDKGKSDLERIGLFSEAGYTTINDLFKDKKSAPCCEEKFKGKQMLIAGEHHGQLPDSFFDKKFVRVFEGESWADPIQRERRTRNENSKKNIAKAFKPVGTSPKPSGSGSFFGTFGGPLPSLSGASVPDKPKRPVGKNFLTNPGKRGTGYGYLNVTIGTPYAYSSDTYDAMQKQMKEERERHKQRLVGKAFINNHAPKSVFDTNPYATDKEFPAKEHDEEKKLDKLPFRPSHPAKSGVWGCFESYPAHDSGNEPAEPPVRKERHQAPIFRPSGGSKSIPFKSIVEMNVPLRPLAYL
eukprot:Opistho-2@59875